MLDKHGLVSLFKYSSPSCHVLAFGHTNDFDFDNGTRKTNNNVEDKNACRLTDNLLHHGRFASCGLLI